MAKRKTWKEYHFSDGIIIYVRGMSANEKAHEERRHGKLLYIVDTGISY